MTKGWYGQGHRHAMASRGIRTNGLKASGKIFSTKYFELEDNVYIKCWAESTRSGFRHFAELKVDGESIAKVKVTYQNRTWEKYEFETAIERLMMVIDRPEIEKQAIMGTVEKQAIGHLEDNMKTIAMVSSLGNIFGTTIKERNDWKLRMIKAGMGDGIQLPDDWDSLPEEDKEARLDKIIEFMEE